MPASGPLSTCDRPRVHRGWGKLRARLFGNLMLSEFLIVVIILPVYLAVPRVALAGAYIFANEANGVDLVLHPQGYTGSETALTVEVCIDPTSLVPTGASTLADLEQAVINNIGVWNTLQPQVGNALLANANDVPAGAIDFESVSLHEIGHCIGLAHVNAASESGLPGDDRNYTKAADGINNLLEVGAGTDGVRGTRDDIRGDDINLHWFRTDSNDPGQLPLPLVVDSTTYARDLLSLPSDDLFAQNLDRTAAAVMGHPSSYPIYTEAVMQQGSFSDEAQRQLTADGVATLMLGMAGVDEIAGTADDYTLTLVYGGISAAASCDLSIAFEQMSGLAYCSVSGGFIDSPPDTTHVSITSGYMRFGTGYNWYFNQQPFNPDPCPADLDDDSDGDGYCSGDLFNPPKVGGGDNCPAVANPGQGDADSDGAGDPCDPCTSGVLVLSGLEIDDGRNFVAENNIIAGPLFEISASADVELAAGDAVVFSNSTSVSGRLAVTAGAGACF